MPYSSVSLAALSPDGSMLAYTDTSINSVVVRYPTAGHYTVGDLTVTRPLPPGFVATTSPRSPSTGATSSSWTPGSAPSSTGTPGPTGGSGPRINLYAQLKPSKVRRQSAALSAGLLVYEEGYDLFALDLTSVRWEDVPSGYDSSGALVTAASGSVFFGGTNPSGGSMPLYARCADGRDTTLGTYANWFSADGDYVVYDAGGSGSARATPAAGAPPAASSPARPRPGRSSRRRTRCTRSCSARRCSARTGHGGSRRRR